MRRPAHDDDDRPNHSPARRYGYATIFWLIGLLLDNKDIGMANTHSSPHRVLGWFAYCAIESYGSLSVALFWAFCNSTIDLERAKSAYGLIVCGAQVCPAPRRAREAAAGRRATPPSLPTSPPPTSSRANRRCGHRRNATP